MIGPDADPARVAGHVIDPVGRVATEFRDDEVIDPHRFRLPLRLPLPPGILEVPDQFLLLGIHRDDRLSGLQGGLDLGVDVLELGVPIRMALPLEGLAVSLETIARPVEEFGDHAMAGGVPHPLQLLGQLADTLAGPPQG
jgi:hypothetical protein